MYMPGVSFGVCSGVALSDFHKRRSAFGNRNQFIGASSSNLAMFDKEGGPSLPFGMGDSFFGFAKMDASGSPGVV
jgi:hypothetical protein